MTFSLASNGLLLGYLSLTFTSRFPRHVTQVAAACELPEVVGLLLLLSCDSSSEELLLLTVASHF